MCYLHDFGDHGTRADYCVQGFQGRKRDAFPSCLGIVHVSSLFYRMGLFGTVMDRITNIIGGFMSLLNLIGCVLVLMPVVLIIGAMVCDIGWKGAFIVLTGTALLLGFIFSGFYLIGL